MPDEIERLRKEAEKRATQKPGESRDARTLDHPGKPVSGICAPCGFTIILHCESCKEQISGCGCTLNKLIGEEQDKVRAQRLGLWTPDSNN